MKSINMIQMTQFNPDELKFSIYNPKTHVLPKLDFTQTNGQDPLGVQKYYENQILNNELKDIEFVYVIRYSNNWVGFFSIDLAKVQVHKSHMSTEIDSTYKESPSSLLIKKIGIDKDYRCYGVGKYILLFCTGLAQKINNDRQCRTIIFKTTRSLADKIYCPKYQFNYSNKDIDKKLIWVYKKIY